jgi:hypothetical protein
LCLRAERQLGQGMEVDRDDVPASLKASKEDGREFGNWRLSRRALENTAASFRLWERQRSLTIALAGLAKVVLSCPDSEAHHRDAIVYCDYQAGERNADPDPCCDVHV